MEGSQYREIRRRRRSPGRAPVAQTVFIRRYLLALVGFSLVVFGCTDITLFCSAVSSSTPPPSKESFDELPTSPPFSWVARLYRTARPYLPSFLQSWELQLPSESFPECLHFPSLTQLSEDARIVQPILHRLKQRTFFRIFKLSLLADTCADPRLDHLLRDNADKCTEPQRCGLCQCSDDEIPQTWRQKPDEEFVDRRHSASFTRWTQDQSSRQPDDPFSMFKTPERLQGGTFPKRNVTQATGVYVDLLLNPPCFTKYDGGAVWRLLYDQVPLPHLQNEGAVAGSGKSSESENLFPESLNDPHLSGASSAWACSNNANLRRFLSGMQANIAALAAANFNTRDDAPPPMPYPTTSMVPPNSGGNGGNGTPAPPVFISNLDFFRERLAVHPARIQNLYFTFGVLLRAACGLTDILQECSCETGNNREDLSTRAELLHMLNVTTSSLHACSSDHMNEPFFDSSRLHFLQTTEGIDKLLRCVPCEKCRLHGKIKLTALHIAARMLSPLHAMPSLERNQVAALINALYYFAESIRVVEHMQDRIYMHNVSVCAFFIALLLLVLLFIVYFVWTSGVRSRRKRRQKLMLSKKKLI
ncbi:putative endoplasmic reticulum oxidoreductin [Toxoplasma gondii MAS]|uniref:Putative endoplasmic reticulum oxidoreductin n=1 Tax=Toxoplasma gondii MAS TaxID=943118 RepID=A0A086PVB0_TOXGO|nr:putative endoplasmic reticulum oxidoreductin [Toxoplasma gondii MAS]